MRVRKLCDYFVSLQKPFMLKNMLVNKEIKSSHCEVGYK